MSDNLTFLTMAYKRAEIYEGTNGNYYYWNIFNQRADDSQFQSTSQSHPFLMIKLFRPSKDDYTSTHRTTQSTVFLTQLKGKSVYREIS